jgi:hypothetical protein
MIAGRRRHWQVCQGGLGHGASLELNRCLGAPWGLVRPHRRGQSMRTGRGAVVGRQGSFITILVFGNGLPQPGWACEPWRRPRAAGRVPSTGSSLLCKRSTWNPWKVWITHTTCRYNGHAPSRDPRLWTRPAAAGMHPAGSHSPPWVMQLTVHASGNEIDDGLSRLCHKVRYGEFDEAALSCLSRRPWPLQSAFSRPASTVPRFWTIESRL